MKFRYILFLSLSSSSLFAEEVELRPSVWGTEKWYGGYEAFSKAGKIGEIKPSVWGTKKWPGGYDFYKDNLRVGEARASAWGQEKWYGGYEVLFKDRPAK